MDKKQNPVVNMFWIALGGMLGALLRHGTNYLVTSQFGDSYIYISTAFENVFGSFLMGYLFTYLMRRHPKKEWLSHLLLVGMIGSYTTYSGFGTQSITLIQESAPLFMLYFFGQIFTGIISVLAGIKLADNRNPED
jgi:fluoride exporter